MTRRRKAGGLFREERRPSCRRNGFGHARLSVLARLFEVGGMKEEKEVSDEIYFPKEGEKRLF